MLDETQSLRVKHECNDYSLSLLVTGNLKKNSDPARSSSSNEPENIIKAECTSRQEQEFTPAPRKPTLPSTNLQNTAPLSLPKIQFQFQFQPKTLTQQKRFHVPYVPLHSTVWKH